MDKQLEQEQWSEQEEWRNVKGYEGRYQISNLGRVRSVKAKRTKLKSNVYRIQSKHKLVKTTVSAGHPRVVLCKEGHRTSVKVCRLMAVNFLPEVDGIADLVHLDGNKLNNKVENLKWMFYKTQIHRRRGSMKKYKTLSELKAAYESGEISKEDSLTIDNDSTTVYIPDLEANNDYIKVFDGAVHLNFLKRL